MPVLALAAAVAASLAAASPAPFSPAPRTTKLGSARLLAAELPAPPLAAARLRRLAEAPAAAYVESPHFALVTDTPDLANAVLDTLELVYAEHIRFLSRLHVPIRRPSAKLQWIIARRPPPPDVATTHAARVIAFFDPRTGVSAALPPESIALAPAAPRQDADARRAIFLAAIRHEAAHQIQWSIGLTADTDRAPLWLLEGLATLFESSPTVDRGGASPERSAGLTQRDPCATLPLHALQTLLSDDNAWCGADCYASAAAVTATLHDRHPGAFATLLRRLAAGEPLPGDPHARLAAIEALFGPVDLAWLAPRDPASTARRCGAAAAEPAALRRAVQFRGAAR